MAKFKLMDFARETRQEIAKVTWPSRKETITTTVLIVVMALVAGVFFFAADSAIGFGISKLLSMRS